MSKYPDSPEEWNDAGNTVYRDFTFTSTPDIECLIRLVKENIDDRGNSAYLRSRLLGILLSMYSKANSRFWIEQKHPKTWRIRFFYSNMIRKYRRAFKTKKFKDEVMLCNIATEIIKPF